MVVEAANVWLGAQGSCPSQNILTLAPAIQICFRMEVLLGNCALLLLCFLLVNACNSFFLIACSRFSSSEVSQWAMHQIRSITLLVTLVRPFSVLISIPYQLFPCSLLLPFPFALCRQRLAAAGACQRQRWAWFRKASQLCGVECSLPPHILEWERGRSEGRESSSSIYTWKRRVLQKQSIISTWKMQAEPAGKSS